MTTGPTDGTVTTAAGGPDGMPLALKFNEGLGAWQPIETAPRDAWILLWGKFWNDRDSFRHPLIGIWVPTEDRWIISGEFRFGVRPTHWKPLPAPPQ